MITLLRVIIIIVLLSPPIALGAMNLFDTHVPVELLIVTITASLMAIICWACLSERFGRLHHHAQVIHQALQKDQETDEALVEPLKAKPVRNDPIYQAMLELAERLSDRRYQIRDTVDKVGGILITLSQNRPLEVNSSEFNVPDQDDQTLLLGSLCQLITSLQQSRQRGDVFANVLRESPIAMLITDAQFKVRSMNPSAEKLFGYSLQQMLNHSMMGFFTPPPLKSNQAHLKKIVLNGEDAIQALKGGRQEVFTTIMTGYGKVHLIGLRASFGTHCLFVIRERSKDKVNADIQGPDTLHLDDAVPTLRMESPVVAQ